MTEKKPPEKIRVREKEYYAKVRSESRGTLARVAPSIVLYVVTVLLVWLFGNLIFLPIAEGIEWGWPLVEILNFIILAALVSLLLKILVDVRGAIGAVAGIAACEIGAPYDVSPEEIGHYRTAMRGVFYVIVVSLGYLLLADYLTRIHPGLSAVGLVVIVVWAIYQIWSAVRAISEEIKRYTSQWAEKIP
ncbi:hypothetical protein KAU93_04160 [Candidatus Bathyarchaeota archaeon]|nr:hypothetical protein [Candidatus Bathyarchaeota archaeon]